jgi:valyl-tRNA synthetase
MMPFVTEEIWRRLPLEPGHSADSLMVAAWPDAAGLVSWQDEGAERSVAALQEIVVAVRGIRARYQVPPKTRVEVIVKAAGADALLIENLRDQIAALAGVGELLVDAAASKPAHGAAAVAAGAEIYVPLEGLVDFDAERDRVAREIAKLRPDLEKLERKLANEGFLAKAAPEIVEKDRGKATELRDTVATLEAQLAELEG